MRNGGYDVANVCPRAFVPSYKSVPEGPWSPQSGRHGPSHGTSAAGGEDSGPNNIPPRLGSAPPPPRARRRWRWRGGCLGGWFASRYPVLGLTPQASAISPVPRTFGTDHESDRPSRGCGNGP